MDLTAIEEIRQLKYRYFRTLDLKMWDEFGDCLAEDVRARYGTQAMDKPLHYDNRADVVDFMSNNLGGGIVTIHIANHPEIEVDGTRRWTWPVSTGVRNYETPSGSYKAFRMEKDHFSKEWDEAPMPHSIFFTMKGHAIHGSYQTRRLGRRASHGCVRLSPANAAKLYAVVEQQGVTNARVIVTGGGSRRR